jgi:hypothetical protein
LTDNATTHSARQVSFRDPGGVVIALRGRIFRILNAQAQGESSAFRSLPAATKSVESGELVRTWDVDPVETAALMDDPTFRHAFDAVGGVQVVEHERVPFPSYPYEWPPEMLYVAADLTLKLATRFLNDRFSLKDGTPLNVLFRGPNPVHVDLLSFECREAGDPAWLPYAQFVRTFVLPLLVNKHFRLPIDQMLTVRRDGLEPEDVYRWLGLAQRFQRPFFGLVSMPTWLGRSRRAEDASIYRKNLLDDSERAAYILQTAFRGLRRALTRAQPRAGIHSVWSDYAGTHTYSDSQFAAKEKFVKQALAELAPKTVLDVGCNTGHFSALAARSGASVVAIDYDPVVVGSVWAAAREAKLDILPLVVNLARPTPALGWNNSEFPSFLDRARGSFEMVMMLAVIHHMLVTERVPLESILKTAAGLTTHYAIVEWIEPADSMFQKLLRGRQSLHLGLSPEVFESAAARHFRILRKTSIEGSSRWLYLLQRNTSSDR